MLRYATADLAWAAAIGAVLIRGGGVAIAATAHKTAHTIAHPQIIVEAARWGVARVPANLAAIGERHLPDKAVLAMLIALKVIGPKAAAKLMSGL